MICLRQWICGLMCGARAQSVTELALALPFLASVLLGTVDFARVYYLQSAVLNAANTGAQFALDSHHTPAEVQAIIVQEAAPLVNIDATRDITLTATPSWAPGSQLNVQVAQQFSAITPFISALWGGGTLPVRAAVIVRFSP